MPRTASEPSVMHVRLSILGAKDQDMHLPSSAIEKWASCKNLYSAHLAILPVRAVRCISQGRCNIPTKTERVLGPSSDAMNQAPAIRQCGTKILLITHRRLQCILCTLTLPCQGYIAYSCDEHVHCNMEPGCGVRKGRHWL